MMHDMCAEMTSWRAPPNQGNELEGFYMGSEDESAECGTALDVEPRMGEDGTIMESPASKESVEPSVGMEFVSEEEAKVFYNDYARRKGFIIRISSFYCSKLNGEKISREFVCSKQGFMKSTDGSNNDASNGGKKRRKRLTKRTGCMAMMTVRKQDPSGKWVVVKFRKDHNHPLMSPNDAWRMRSGRNASDPKRNWIDHHQEKRMKARKAMSMSKADSGGLSNVDFSDRECLNHIIKKRWRSFGKDAQNILEYLKRKQAENPTFFYAAEVDEKQCVTKVFWVDGRSRMAYDYFGDVITFDTSYRSKRFRLPFTSFIGVNNHKQSVLFGCALIADETISTFVWLFKTWLAAMNGRHPVSIITDHDKAIRAAVATVFPESHHRFCLRHISRKQNKKLPHVIFEHPHFQGEFLKCVRQTETIDEFESSWEMLLDKYVLRESDWIKSLYEDRRQWVPVYLRGKFFADMSTTKQIDIMDSFFDGYVDAQTTQQVFVAQYEKALNDHYEKEDEEYLAIDTLPTMCTRSAMEKQAASTYTRKVFEIFQEELLEICNFSVNKIDDDGATNVYRVARLHQERNAHTVAFNASEMRVNCSCKKFEFSGILCRHVLSVFRVANIFTIPPHYILKRWTKNAKSEVVLDQYGDEMQANCHERTTLRYNILCREALKFIEEAALSTDVFNVAMGAIRDAAKKVAAAKESAARAEKMGTMVNGSTYDENINVVGDMTNHVAFLEPDQSRTRGKAPTPRLKPPGSSCRTPTCSFCKGPKHNIRSCPLAANVSTVEQLNEGNPNISGQCGTQNTILNLFSPSGWDGV
ncbi:protein FAR1-RELATED SEQUENCE 5-like [Magnolia sinica]|uniref:protein FAR1-RELATED SEQUENCE 5-like n=1 Tax=Magnolia sinica TaxID=86752 RepID=UPI002658E307|nr:protein FAR1-RELATED SEQUENCE 5-like [Magnolia sinica]XP_058105725.1 protein FAR1-RELATED SEQUENCE 5-like [Magnolia sinica]XP_058105726.1 protein FAR1-RELATED SEQUENCE 5-like [Magnolia sinica]XP_058105727.1 protein FAR1-RELATED SEQUENCE 5-like [Magnolia sinica]